MEELDKIQPEKCIAAEAYIYKYEAIASDVDAAMQVGLSSAWQINKGFSRLNTLTEAS